MSTDRRWPPLAAVAALLLQSAASAFAYAPRLAPPGIPSSPPREVVASARPFGELRFTLDPRIGLFAAGDPINQMDPDGRLKTGFNAGAQFSTRMFEGFAEGHVSSWKYDASGQQVVDWGNGQAFYTGLSNSANLTQKLGYLAGGAAVSIPNLATSVGRAFQSGINLLADVTGQDPGIVELEVGVASLGAAPLSRALRMQTARWNSSIASSFEMRMGGAATNPSKAGALFPPEPPAPIQFGRVENQISHTFRHVEAAGLDRGVVQSAVERHLRPLVSQIEADKPFIQIIEVEGKQLQYTAYRLSDGTINVGRIHPVNP